MNIRPYRESDWPQLWPVIETVFRSGETYPFPPETTQSEAHTAWVEAPQATYVATGENHEILASYYIKPNQPGLGSHVCNCGYLVAENARGKGVATCLCEHSQAVAVELGFRAMQYNLVVATNEVAFHLWKKQGFQVVGRLPGAFNSRSAGYVDAFVMYKELVQQA